METKQEILKSARELFNTYGVSKTTMRDIAKKINISPGNLTYHYRYKEQIIESIYFELVTKMDEGVLLITNNTVQLSLFYKAFESMMHTVFNYRFIFRELYRILSENPKIKNHYIQLKEKRDEQFIEIISHLVKNNIIRQEKIHGEYKRLCTRIYMLGDNWINALELYNFSYPKDIIFFTNLIFETLYPYMLDKGEKEYLVLVENTE